MKIKYTTSSKSFAPGKLLLIKSIDVQSYRNTSIDVQSYRHTSIEVEFPLVAIIAVYLSDYL